MRACFTGHRPDKLEAAGQIPLEQVSESLHDSIVSAINDGITTFISGMCPGIDILAAEEVIKLRATDSRIKLIAAMPYPKFAFNWEGWGDRVQSVLAMADFVQYVSSNYTGRGVFQIRNEWMVNHSSRLIAYWNGTPGGTKNTVDAAKQTGIEIVNSYISYENKEGNQMKRYELLYLTQNGTVFGMFDSYDEFMETFKYARKNKCPCITRCIDDNSGEVVKAKTFDKTYANEFSDMIDMLREAVNAFTEP